MKKTIFCGRAGRKKAAIDDCIQCSNLCVNNPNATATGIWNRDFENLWGAKEIEQCVERRRQEYQSKNNPNKI